jgi:hypothetical protein
MSDKIYYELLTSPLCRPRHNGTKGSHYAGLSTFTSGLHSEVSAPGVVCRAAQRIGRGLSGTGEEGHLRPAQVFGGGCGGLSPGEKRHSQGGL